MVTAVGQELLQSHYVSVLALSSRFDGRHQRVRAGMGSSVSVLALSSRFDGRRCRSVTLLYLLVSVLALSSRFDGLWFGGHCASSSISFSTRSVESF